MFKILNFNMSIHELEQEINMLIHELEQNVI